MAIERKIFEYYDTWANNVAEVVDWIGTLPNGLVIDSTGVIVTLNNGTTISLNGHNGAQFRYGYRTSNGILIFSANNYSAMAITKSNRGSDAVIVRLEASGSTQNRNYNYHALDLTYSTADYNRIGSGSDQGFSPKAADITAFLPMVCGGGTYTPKLFACCARQYSTYGTMAAGGKQYAYDGYLALED